MKNQLNWKHKIGIGIYFFITLSLTSCNPSSLKVEHLRSVCKKGTNLWPDVSNCAIPVNIAPINFYILKEHSSYRLEAIGSASQTKLVEKGRYKVCFNDQEWSDLLHQNRDTSIKVSIELQLKDHHSEKIEFEWKIRDSIDPYLTYRLIEPSYQMSLLLQTKERNLSNFTERTLFDNRLQVFGCVNCHTYCQNDGDYLVYHVRFNRTGTFITRGDSIIRVNLKSEYFPQGGVYPAWHPNKRFIAFGTSSAYPFIHSKDIVRRSEVYDSLGDMILYDIEQNKIITDIRMAGDSYEETFPCWSPDGEYLYFCQSETPVRKPEDDDNEYAQRIKYSLVRMRFIDSLGNFTEKDTLINADTTGKTISFPRISPDGRFLVFCLSDHGTFPIRHPESDLYLLDLSQQLADSSWENTGSHFKMKRMSHINSQYTESYHCWSSNGRWIVTSSKRDDGMYARPYISYIDEKGQDHKAFPLPQKDPAIYLNMLQSFNVPELSANPTSTDAQKAKEASLYPTITPQNIEVFDGQLPLPLDTIPKRIQSNDIL